MTVAARLSVPPRMDRLDAGLQLAETPAPRSPTESVRQLVEAVARSTVTVLLIGEPDVGKGVAAEWLHALSVRSRHPFVRVTCTEPTPARFERDLLGFGRSAGLIESAHGGTLFFDDVAKLSLEMQAKLVGVLESRKVQRGGASTPRSVDVRFVAATSGDLDVEVAAGRFRKDLLLRINGLSMRIPPLRERRGEILELAHTFVRDGARRLGAHPPTLTSEAEARLLAHDWPGNIRELQQVIERGCIMSAHEGTLRPEHLMRDHGGRAESAREAGLLRDAVAEAERASIQAALGQANGHQSKAAALLGVSRRTLINRLVEYGLPRPRKKDA